MTASTNHSNRISRALTVLILAAAGLFWTARLAHAHTRVEIGPYTVDIGWLKEPVIVGERNALVLEITEGGTAVEGLEGSLELTLLYGGETFNGQLTPAETPGVYITEIFPTVRGQYEVQLTGTIGAETVDVILEPEAVQPANVLQFPEPQPDPNTLAAELDTLTESLDRLQTLATLGLVAGVFGLLLGAAALTSSLRKPTLTGSLSDPSEHPEKN